MATATDEKAGGLKSVPDPDDEVAEAQRAERDRVEALAAEAGAAADEAAIAAANERPEEAQKERSIEDLADDETPTPPMQMALPGTGDRIIGRMGGNKPTSSEIRLMGGRLPVEGQFEKGEVITLIIEAKVGEAGEVDAHDPYGNVLKTVRVHKARMISVKRLNS